MHCQRELAKESRGLGAAIARFKSLRGAPKARCQGQMLVVIAKLPE